MVENRAAIAYFACVNRNQSLYFALQDWFIAQENESGEEGSQAGFDTKSPLEEIFKKIMIDYDFMSIVMYPDLKNRREFVHDCWIIAKASENDELKLSISRDPYFYLLRDDLLELLRTHDDNMITHILATDCMLQIREDISYKLIAIKGA